MCETWCGIDHLVEIMNPIMCYLSSIEFSGSSSIDDEHRTCKITGLPTKNWWSVDQFWKPPIWFPYNCISNIQTNIFGDWLDSYD